MPSRANDSFLLGYVIYYNSTPLMCQCPLGLMTHFYHWQLFLSVSLRRCVSMPSRANDSFLLEKPEDAKIARMIVSMPSRANDSFLRYVKRIRSYESVIKCQCPLGLMTHFYSGNHVETHGENTRCQCPLGLMTHFYKGPRLYARRSI